MLYSGRLTLELLLDLSFFLSSAAYTRALLNSPLFSVPTHANSYDKSTEFPSSPQLRLIHLLTESLPRISFTQHKKTPGNGHTSVYAQFYISNLPIIKVYFSENDDLTTRHFSWCGVELTIFPSVCGAAICFLCHDSRVFSWSLSGFQYFLALCMKRRLLSFQLDRADV